MHCAQASSEAPSLAMPSNAREPMPSGAREPMLAAYRDAIEGGFRFYSYGDAMLIANGLGERAEGES